MIDSTNIFVDLPELFKVMAESLTMVRNSAPAFNVETVMTNLSTTGAKPIISISNLQLDQQVSVGCQCWKQTGRIHIAVRSMGGSNPLQADQQAGIIFGSFSAMQWMQCRLSFTYKSVVYTNAYISQFGLTDLSTATGSTYTDVTKNEQYREIVVRFAINWKSNHLIE